MGKKQGRLTGKEERQEKEEEGSIEVAIVCPGMDIGVRRSYVWIDMSRPLNGTLLWRGRGVRGTGERETSSFSRLWTARTL